MLGKHVRFASMALFLAAAALPARAELDLTILRNGDSYLKPTLQVDSALFYEHNAWFGKSRENAGDHVGFWGEFGVMPGLEGQLVLDELGTLRARVSGVWTTTQFGLDAAGSNFDDRHPSRITLEDAYVGWTSGDLFPSLGKDAIDLSVGSQKYQVGSGFLFWDGSTDGGSTRGGYWLGMRKAFEMTAIARLRTGPFMGEVVYLKPNDAPDSSTDVVGTNFEWSFGERAKLGAGYWYFADSEILRRDGLHVFDLRGDVHPLLTMVEVDPKDPGFGNPTKFVGPVYEKQEADRIGPEKGWVFKQDGPHWRRVVASPEPKRIFEIRPVRWLLERGTVVICAGGGGIPTMYEPGTDRKLVGVEAVVDKDACSELLAREVEADLFVMATDTPAVFIDWGKPGQKAIHRAHPAAMEKYEFPAGSMGPKVDAACHFALATGRTAAIGALADIEGIVRGEKGSLFSRKFDEVTFHP